MRYDKNVCDWLSRKKRKNFFRLILNHSLKSALARLNWLVIYKDKKFLIISDKVGIDPTKRQNVQKIFYLSFNQRGQMETNISVFIRIA